MVPFGLSLKYVNGWNLSLFTKTPFKKYFTHATFFSLHFAGLLNTIASMFNAQVGKSIMLTTGVKSRTMGGVTDKSRMLKSTMVLLHGIGTVAFVMATTTTIGSVTKRIVIAMIFIMVLVRMSGSFFFKQHFLLVYA
jgi:hypothetical protein